MNTDIRLSVEFATHPKTLKLRRRLGAEGVLSLISLWLWSARNRPEGVLRDMDEDDIEVCAEWRGDSNALVTVLTEIGFLDKTNGVYELHNWAWRNPWAAKSGERSAAARLSRLARVNPGIVKTLKAEGRTGIAEEEYQKYVRGTKRSTKRTTKRSTQSSTPTPTPDPTPDPNSLETERMGEVTERIAADESAAARNGVPAKIHRIYEHWNGMDALVRHRSLSRKARQAVNARLRDYGEDELLRAVSRYAELCQRGTGPGYCKWGLEELMSRGEGKWVALMLDADYQGIRERGRPSVGDYNRESVRAVLERDGGES